MKLNQIALAAIFALLIQPASAAATSYNFSTDPHISFSVASKVGTIGDYLFSTPGNMAWSTAYRFEPAGIDINLVAPSHTLEIKRNDGGLFSLDSLSIFEAGTTLDVINMDVIGTDANGLTHTSTQYYYGPASNTFSVLSDPAFQNVTKIILDTTLGYRLTALTLTSNTVAIPEPNNQALLLAGLALMGLITRAKQKSA